MRGISIEIGAGVVLAGLGGFDSWGNLPTPILLIVAGVLLILHGTYEAFVKPRFRVDQRLNDWLQRRGWNVRIESSSQFNFVLHLIAPDSGKEVFVTRNKGVRDDVLAFTGKAGLDPKWLPALANMSEKKRQVLIQEITIFLAAKNIGFELANPLDPSKTIRWPPNVIVQMALPQDHTLSQHSVDLAAKSIEQSIIGVRALIRKAVVEATPDTAPSSRPGAP